MRHRSVSAGFAAAVLSLLLACSPGQDAQTGDVDLAGGSEAPTGDASEQPSASESTATGGTVRIGIGGSPDSLNPGNGLLEESYQLYELIYDTPLTIDLEGNYVPELAESWDVSADGRTWTLNLVDDATFHDGEPVTARDVKFSLELYRDTEDFPYLSSYPEGFTKIEAPDDQTVRITTKEPVGNFESRMVFIYVLPEHIWADVRDPVEFDNTEMIGSGPFRLAQYRQKEFTRLEANDDHFLTPPNVDEVIFTTIGNADARVQALRNGDVDMITEFPLTAVATLRGDSNVSIAQGAPFAPELRDLIFNVVSAADCPDDGECTGHPALQEVEVRRALMSAVDKQQIIDVAKLGLAEPGLTFVPSGLGPFYADEISDYPFDLEAAGQMLEEAGYTDSDGNGVRECKPDQDCEELSLRLQYANDIDTAPRETELIADWWRQIGVDVRVQGLDPDTLTSVCCPTFDYDVILWGWGSDPDPQFLLGTALCTEIDTGFSESGYCNPRYDELYDEQAVETDPERRIEIVHEMQQILVDDLPFAAVYYPEAVQAYRNDRFTGWLDSAPRLALQDTTSLVVIRPAE